MFIIVKKHKKCLKNTLISYKSKKKHLFVFLLPQNITLN